ncbi:MAG: carboxypeptidase regulatory-like domain-containing protein, partial [Myxococcota bacterium]|nr:carboxypeptidase regulatory-like domain-containing protein [Myxococcota bacterium]
MRNGTRRAMPWVLGTLMLLAVGCDDGDGAADDGGANDTAADADTGADGDTPDVADDSDAETDGDALGDADGARTGSVQGYVMLQGQVDHSAVSVAIDGTGLTDDSDSTGFWSIASVPAGTYTVTASRAGFASATSSPFEVRAGETTTAPPLTLNATLGSLSGTALLVDASDHSGIAVAVEGTSHATTTNAAGAWSITGVAVGNYAVRARRVGYV